jgi:hypothetical protein
MFPWDKKRSSTQKSQLHFCINSFLAHKLSHDRWLWFFFGGAHGSLPDAVIRWCLRTGGGSILTSGTTTRHNDGNTPHDDGDGQQDDDWHNNGTGRHGDGRHDDGKGSRAAG